MAEWCIGLLSEGDKVGFDCSCKNVSRSELGDSEEMEASEVVADPGLQGLLM